MSSGALLEISRLMISGECGGVESAEEPLPHQSGVVLGGQRVQLQST